jgi:hypothetical protein
MMNIDDIYNISKQIRQLWKTLQFITQKRAPGHSSGVSVTDNSKEREDNSLSSFLFIQEVRVCSQFFVKFWTQLLQRPAITHKKVKSDK